VHSLLCSAYAGRNPEGFPSHNSWGSVYKIYSKTVYSASFRMVIVFSAKSFASTIIRRKPFGVPPYVLRPNRSAKLVGHLFGTEKPSESATTAGLWAFIGVLYLLVHV